MNTQNVLFSRTARSIVAGFGIIACVVSIALPTQAGDPPRGRGNFPPRPQLPGGLNDDRNRNERDRDYRNRDRDRDSRDRYDNDRWNRDRGVSWNDIDRRPNVRSNDRAGFYVWRERDDLFIVANDADRSRSSRFSGTITVQDGRLDNVRGFDTERSDRVSQNGDNRAQFNFQTADGLDGIRVHIDRGRRIVLNLSAGGRESERVYIGQDKRPTNASGTLVIER